MTHLGKIRISYPVEDISHRLPARIRNHGGSLTARDNGDMVTLVLVNESIGFRGVLRQSKMYENRSLLSGLLDSYYNFSSLPKITPVKKDKK